MPLPLLQLLVPPDNLLDSLPNLPALLDHTQINTYGRFSEYHTHGIDSHIALMHIEMKVEEQ